MEVVPTWYNLAKGGGYGRSVDIIVGAIYLTSIGVDSNVLMPLLNATQAVHTGYMRRDGLAVDEKLVVIDLESECEGLISEPDPGHRLLRAKPGESRSILDLIEQYGPAPDEYDAVLELLAYSATFVKVVEEYE